MVYTVYGIYIYADEILPFFHLCHYICIRLCVFMHFSRLCVAAGLSLLCYDSVSLESWVYLSRPTEIWAQTHVFYCTSYFDRLYIFIKVVIFYTLIKLCTKDNSCDVDGMIRIQQDLTSTIRQHEWSSGVAEGLRGRIHGKSTILWILKMNEKIIEACSSFTH